MAQDVALRKRQQIAKANRMMFMWVTAASVVIGVSMVVSVFLVQRLLFNEKVLGEKQKTVTTLQNNNKVVDKLKDNIRVLNTKQALLDARTESERVVIPGNESKPLQVVLDALPADPNSTALGSSLQEVLLKSDKITIESLTVDPVSADGTSLTASSNGNTITFSMSVSAPDANSLRDLLSRLEHSIRAIDIQSLNIEIQGTKIVMTMTAQAFYEPGVTTDLKSKVVKP